ncbi:PAS domain S-box protein [Paenibacillus sp. LHD-117]|uniref:PAS domain S-box protein n=1 Tax=Paenibacillus sp. LHD-117 TaxID=3071412 RepID=UPI0027E05E54|nr:PAS domain S-box protein [Paenibacillus sp. LHD-117]MDQ6422220.1 PAS domain S-box protein [Paenibacillus sp. LHD-117]
MSIKSKLTAAISLMLVSVVILYHLVSEYSMVQGFKQLMAESMRNSAEQAEQAVADYVNRTNAYGENSLPGLEAMFRQIRRVNPMIKEITVFREDSNDIAFGTYAYIDANNDPFIAQALQGNSFEYKETKYNGDPHFRSYYSSGKLQGYVVSIVYDQSIMNQMVGMKRNNALLFTGLFLLLMMVLIYVLVGFMIRPLKDILWKVNEVSSVRFHKPIQIKRKDEFGLLALKINAMSQNLSIYMSKLRKAFEENRRMKEHLESFINHSYDAIHLMDLDGKVIQINRAFEQLFGYEESEVLGMRFPTVPDTHRMEKRQMIGLLLAGKKLPAQETVRMTKSGEIIPVSVMVSPIRDSDGTIRAFASICRDMRSRNRMEELLRRSEKLTTVGQLAAGVAHEIRNPLTTLRGFLQLQQQSQKLNVSHVNLMLSELDRINLIVGEFLILAKPQATKFVTKDVRDVLNDVLVFLDSEAHLHNIEFRTVITEEECRISCEENQLKQVFINLLKNAIEAMPGGGSVHISIQRKSDRIAISITDEGVGIPEELISKIGDPFFTAKETGTGLGIMVSQRIINSHQGTLDIQSQVNVGTSVKVTLPAQKPERKEDLPAAQ